MRCRKRTQFDCKCKTFAGSAGVNVNENDPGGRTALHCVALANNREGARMRLCHPTINSINSKDNDGKTALKMAVEKGHNPSV